MAQKRIQVRVPIAGNAILSAQQGPPIYASVKDISQDGLGLIETSEAIEHIEYQIEITTVKNLQIQLNAALVHQSDSFTGFQTSTINEKNIAIISDLIAEYQGTEDFIKQLDEHDLLDQKFIDEDGSEIPVTFEAD